MRKRPHSDEEVSTPTYTGKIGDNMKSITDKHKGINNNGVYVYCIQS